MTEPVVITMLEDEHGLVCGDPTVDAKGNPRRRYVRVISGDRSCVMAPAEAADMVACDPAAFRTLDVLLSVEEFNALPEFGGF